MVLLHKKQISLLRQKVDKMLALLKMYDKSETAKFRPTLQIIANNLNYS